MQGTRFRKVFRKSLGSMLRECKIALTPIPKPEKWVFLVGCYNSGTTLLSELMSEHPSISALSTEGHFITDQFVKDYEIGVPRMWVDQESRFRLTEEDEGPDAVRIKKEWGMRLDLNKPVLLEKSPPNSARTRWLQKHFENAYFIGLVRNGYAVAEGISRKGDPKHLNDGWPIEKSAWQWMRGNQILESDSKHLNHFTWVKYEDLTERTAETLNQLADFLELPPFKNYSEAKALSIHERNEAVKNLNNESISRLNKTDINAINAIAVEGLVKFDYPLL